MFVCFEITSFREFHDSSIFMCFMRTNFREIQTPGIFLLFCTKSFNPVPHGGWGGGGDKIAHVFS